MARRRSSSYGRFPNNVRTGAARSSRNVLRDTAANFDGYVKAGPVSDPNERAVGTGKTGRSLVQPPLGHGRVSNRSLLVSNTEVQPGESREPYGISCQPHPEH